MDTKKKIALNTWGVLIYFFAQWLLSILVTRISGYESAGQYSLAVSFTNVFSFIGMFGVRSLQVSDVSRRYTDGQYFALRGVTCLISVLAFAVALPFFGYDKHIVLCCIAMMVFKLAEAVQDVTIGSMQRNERFDHIAVSYTLKAVLTVAAFLIALYLGQPVYVAVAAMTVAFAVSYCVYDIPNICRNSRDENRFTLKGTLRIVKESFPLMLTALLDAVLIYIPRDAVERVLGSEALGYYSTISIVVVVLSTLGSGVWGSLMPRISALIYAKDYPAVRKTVNIVAVSMVVLTILVLTLGSLLGPFFFALVFGSEILDYMFLLVPVLINAILLLANSFFQCVFVPLYKRSVLLVSDAVAAIVCMLLVTTLVERLGLIGACFGLTCGLAVRLVILTVLYFYYLADKNKKRWLINNGL